MPAAANLQPFTLDVQTLSFVAVCIAAMLGVILIFAWLQQRKVRALAWWGSAYLIGASSLVLWSAPFHIFTVPPEVAGALIFIAIWLAVAALSRYSSLAALVASALTPAALWYLDQPDVAVLFLLLSALLWIMHRANIARLLNGSEGKIGAKSSA